MHGRIWEYFPWILSGKISLPECHVEFHCAHITTHLAQLWLSLADWQPVPPTTATWKRPSVCDAAFCSPLPPLRVSRTHNLTHLKKHLGKYSHYFKISLLNTEVAIATKKTINKVNKYITETQKKAIVMPFCNHFKIQNKPTKIAFLILFLSFFQGLFHKVPSAN